MKRHYKSDFALTLNEIGAVSGEVVNLLAENDFSGEVFTKTSFPFSRKGDVWENCRLVEGKVVVVCDNHGLTPGRVMLRLSVDVPNALYPDGMQTISGVYGTDMELGLCGNSDIEDIDVNVVLPYVSPYALAVKNGYEGTEAEYNAMLVDIPRQHQQTVELKEAVERTIEDIEGRITAVVADAEDAEKRTQKCVEDAEKSSTEAQQAVSEAQKSVTEAQQAVALAQRAVAQSQDVIDKVNAASDDVVKCADAIEDIFVVPSRDLTYSGGPQHVTLAAPVSCHNWGARYNLVGIRVDHLMASRLHLDFNIEIHQSINNIAGQAQICWVYQQGVQNQLRIYDDNNVFTDEYGFYTESGKTWLIFTLQRTEALMHVSLDNLCAFVSYNNDFDNPGEVLRFANYQVKMFSALPSQQVTLP